MSMSTWIIITISLACFTGLVIIITLCLLFTATRRYMKSSGSPYKLSYSKRSDSRSENLSPLSISGQRSLKSLHAYKPDLAVEAERDSRYIFERSSNFEYWWGDNKNIASTKPSGRFHTIPVFYHGARIDFGKAENIGNTPGSGVNGMYKKHSASWPSDLKRTACDTMKVDNEFKGDIEL